MKFFTTILLALISLELTAQINIISGTNGSLTITPKGIRGKLPNSTSEDTTNIALGENALQNNVNAKRNIAIGKNALQTLSFNNSGTAYISSNIAIGYEALMFTQPNPKYDGTNNTAVGTQSLRDNTLGSSNSAVGYNSLRRNITGSNNASFGQNSLVFNTTGESNSGFGRGSLYYNTEGNNNVAIGESALYQNKANSNSVAVGSYAMYNADNRTVGIMTNNSALGFSALRGSLNFANNTGTNNTALGANTLYTNTSGSSNTAVGVNSLINNTIGSSNATLGDNTLQSNTTGVSNVAIGSSALSTNTTKSQNVAIGAAAMLNAYDGDVGSHLTVNTAIGTWAMHGSQTPANNTGSNNTAVGGYALVGYTSGSYNTSIGTDSGRNITSGSSNVFLGNASGGTTNVSDKLFIANTNTNNPLIKGDFSTGEVKINSQLRVGGSGDASSSTLQVDGNYAISGKTIFTGSQNNYNLGGKSVIHVNGGGAYTLTGIAGGVDGMIVHIYVSISTDLTLAENSGSSSVGNKIVTGSNADLLISQGGGATLIYDGDAGYWRVIGYKQ